MIMLEEMDLQDMIRSQGRTHEGDQSPENRNPREPPHAVKTHGAGVGIPDFQPPGETNTFVYKFTL